MLSIVSSPSPTRLAAHLADILREAPSDPFTPDWVAVPSAGLRRWLQLELAGHLGAAADRTDGVTANLAMPFPAALLRSVLDADARAHPVGPPPAPGHEPFDPWRLDHLVWSVLEVIRTDPDGQLPDTLTRLPDGATRFGQARRLADLFDRYALHRPGLIRAWHAGDDHDGAGEPLSEALRWQPTLWRLVRAHIDQPSLPERLPEILQRVRAGAYAGHLDLPPRLAVFGVSALPGGSTFLEVIDALAVERDVHVLLLDPCPGATDTVRSATLERGRIGLPIDRAEDPSAGAIRHPLATTWTNPRREATVMLAASEAAGFTRAAPLTPAESTELPDRHTLLARIQHDLRHDHVPAADHQLDPGDRSVQIHACHGPARQLDAARDAILHLLAEHPDLREEDVVVLSPDISRFSPLIEASFGPSIAGPDLRDRSGLGAPTVDPHAPPALRWSLTDRSLRSRHPLLDATAAVLELLGGRFEASAVLALCALPPVRRRFGFDDDALDLIERWAVDANLRWGLDAGHRARWGLPTRFEANSWQAAVDQLLTGSAIGDDDPAFGPGAVAAHGVEGSSVRTLGDLADLLARLRVHAAAAAEVRTAHRWVDFIEGLADDLFAVAPTDAWQRTRLREVLADLDHTARTPAGPSTVLLGLGDVRRMLADALEGTPRRSTFFDGSLTFASLQPLRSVPHRVVCILGFDEIGPAGSGLSGDDLLGLHPQVGDRDPRADTRQALLEAVLAAGDHLIITRTGHDVRTNQAVPPSVPLAELLDTLAGTLHPDHRAAGLARIQVTHGRHPFDTAEVVPHQIVDGPWTFDPRALDGAQARVRRRSPSPAPPVLLPAVADRPVTPAELTAFLLHPVRTFFRDRLNVGLPRRSEDTGDELPVGLDGLVTWGLGADLLTTLDQGRPPTIWSGRAAATGTVPPGVLGDAALDTIATEVGEIRAIAADQPGLLAPPVRFDVDLGEIDGTRVVGAVGRCRPGPDPGPGRVSFTRHGPKILLDLWIDLLALTIHDPTTTWSAAAVARGRDSRSKPVLTRWALAGDGADGRLDIATRALETVIDLHRRALREPLPLFVATSCALATDGTSAAAGAWDGNRSGERTDALHQLAFGDLSFAELLRLPGASHDPEPDPDDPDLCRVQAYAHLLWDTVQRSVVDLTEVTP